MHLSSAGKPGLYDDNRIVEAGGYLTDLLADRAHAWIGQCDPNRPFFLSLHFNAPHWPWEGPMDGDVAAHLNALRHYDGGNLAIFAAMVRAMDSAIGRVLALLRAKGLDDDTIVIFTSDNGGERFSYVWPFTGMKGELLEGGIRVPAIVRWPQRIAAGAHSDQVCISMDWLPTLLAAANGAPAPAYPPDGENPPGGHDRQAAQPSQKTVLALQGQ